jgi:hypothetical protein
MLFLVIYGSKSADLNHFLLALLAIELHGSLGNEQGGLINLF